MVCCIEFCILTLSVCAILLVKILNKNPSPILNVYQRPNGFFWLKFAFMYTVFTLRKWSNAIKSRKTALKLLEYEKPQKLSNHSKAIDAVYFNGANTNGDHFVVGTARRKDQLIDGFFYLLIKDSGLGVLEAPKLPSTSLYQTQDVEEYSAEGIKITPVTPMKEWRISYQGKMKKFENRDEEFDVRFDFTYSSDLPIFNFDTDMDPKLLAKSMAYEKFSREYFNNLKANHQTHYEQFGNVTGNVTIDNKIYKLDIDAVRDHTFGTFRDWRMLHRYGAHFATVENGDRFNVTVLSVPISFSRLIVGYMYSAEDKKIYPVKSCDFELFQHGENGNPPLDYSFTVEAGCKTYVMQVNVLHSPHFYISKDWESKVIERLCTFTVNGKKGWGAAEWLYRNVGGKNVSDYNGN